MRKCSKEESGPSLSVLGVHIRRASLVDIPAMTELAKLNPYAAQWSQAQYERLWDRTESAENHGDCFSEHFVLVAEHSAEGGAPLLIGFLVAHRVDREWELQNIAVSKALHRQGIGAYLLSEFIAQARREKGNEAFLEVRESNSSARAFYRNAGFQESGMRKNYYSQPNENAVLYRLPL
jgi:ribosomal-protein-alanine N-acetyltransferase